MLAGRFNIVLPRRLNGVRVRVPLIDGIKVGITGERWMSEMLRVLIPSCPGGFLDIGVNLGQTLVKVKTLFPDIAYTGCEPNPACIHYVSRLVSVNAWPNVRLLPVGLYDENRILELAGSDEVDGGASVISEFQPSKSGSDARSARFVPLFRFDTIAGGGVVETRDISLIKIDVEGAELEVLGSIANLVESNRPVVLMEVWHSGSDPLKLERAARTSELIDRLDYVVYGWASSKTAPLIRDFAPARIGEGPSDNYLLVPREAEDALIDRVARHVER